MNSGNKRFYDEHPKTCAPDDYWGQVKRTVNGKPVSEDQIALIVDAIGRELSLFADDVLLDLCCGNGALSRLFFARCKGGLGVDYSQYLIEVALRDFAAPPAQDYLCGDAVAYARNEPAPERFTKALCYGAFSLLPQTAAESLLATLRQRFTRIEACVIGNLPDKAKLHDFFRPGTYTPGIEDDPDTPIGIWRTEDEFADLARRTGWQARFHRMPAHFYAAAYRYDAVLTPA